MAVPSAQVFRASYSPRLSHAPDLVQWIRDEGGFIHEGLKLENDGFTGLGLVSSRPISAGIEIISLSRHIPLSLPLLDAHPDDTDSLLLYIARGLPSKYPFSISLFFFSNILNNGVPYISFPFRKWLILRACTCQRVIRVSNLEEKTNNRRIN
jgi:hypothetical protein